MRFKRTLKQKCQTARGVTHPSQMGSYGEARQERHVAADWSGLANRQGAGNLTGEPDRSGWGQAVGKVEDREGTPSQPDRIFP